MNMFNRFFKEAAAAAMALLSLNCVAQADDGQCSLATVRGTYGTKIHAELLGILTGTAPNQVLHRLAVAGVIDAIALQTFDGFGNGTQKDFSMLNGTRAPAPGVGPFEFETNEMFTYTVNPDCTGEMHITFPDGKQITSELLVLDGGKQLYSVVSAYHAAVGPTAADGTSCAQGCTFGIQASTTSVRIGGEQGGR
jgi:hypothetical protein